MEVSEKLNVTDQSELIVKPNLQVTNATSMKITDESSDKNQL